MTRKKNLVFLVFALLFTLACGLSSGNSPSPAPTVEPVSQPPDTPAPVPTSPPVSAPPTDLPPTVVLDEPASIAHLLFPGESGGLGVPSYDVESNGTAPEKRAPFGDSYNLNLLERPFARDMTYLPELDIRAFSAAADDTWVYVTIELIGNNVNRALGIHYGVALDIDRNGYGDFLVWASPPYNRDWTAINVQVFADQNGDSAGLSPLKSDAPFQGDGYETLIFDITQGIGDDPDLAWVRQAREGNLIQFAIKKDLTGTQFFIGVIADAGLKDPGRMDYVDHLTEKDAGSPMRANVNYPVNELFAVDTTCHAAFGFVPTGFEPKVCPRIIPPTQKSSSSGSGADATPVSGCQPPAGGCTSDAPYWWPHPHCACSTIPYNP